VFLFERLRKGRRGVGHPGTGIEKVGGREVKVSEAVSMENDIKRIFQRIPRGKGSVLEVSHEKEEGEEESRWR